MSSAAAEIRSGCIDLFCPSIVSRVEYLRSSVRGAGVVELQFEFPMAPVTLDEEGNTVRMHVASLKPPCHLVRMVDCRLPWRLSS